jgi:hypothetical protein
MKKTFLFFLLLYFFVCTYGQQPGKQHPDKGILPFNAPCTACIEELEKRTDDTREFFSYNNDRSKSIFIQKSLGNMNFKDKDGFWRTKDPRLVQESEKVYAARMQPNPIVIDFQQKFASITIGYNEFRFNKNISLVHIAADGTETSFGPGNWSRITRKENYTETIFLVEEFYPGVDLQMITNCDRVKTNFILKNKFSFDGGWLAMRQELGLPDGFEPDLSASSFVNESMRAGVLNIVNDAEEKQFAFNRSHAYDAKYRTDNFMEMPFKLQANVLDYNVPVEWLKNPATVYPVTLDPVVIVAATLAQTSILGSGFTPVCGTEGCSYYLNNLMTPPNCQITNITTFFSYMSDLPCIRDDGGFDITMFNPNSDSCVTRNFTCLGGIQGACFFWPAFIMNGVPPLAPCLLPPQCTSYSLDFKLMLRRCNWIPFSPCDNSCVYANSDWIINIEGTTAGITAQSGAQIICDTGCATLYLAYEGGLPPYSVSWFPGGLTGNPVTVCPDSTTQYFAILSDSCGNADTSFAFDIVVTSCTGISELKDLISGIVPNPATEHVKINFSPGTKQKSIVLVNAMGEIILEKNSIDGDELILDVSDFSNGIYFLKAGSGSQTSTHKIIIL